MTILSRAFPSLLRRSRLLFPATALFSTSTGKKKLRAPTSPGGQKAEEHAASLDRKDRFQRPMEVPHQEKVENAVHLIGSVAEPIKIVMSKDGVFNAVSILVREATRSTPKFWIPIVFQGELAETAVCHVKENDVVYVTGELCGDQSALPATKIKSMHHFQVVIHDFRFVIDRVSGKNNQTMQEEADRKNNQTMQEEADRIIDQSFVECFGPVKIDQPTLEKDETDIKKPELSEESQWHKFVDHPEEWIDYRKKKQQGLVKPRHPDFKLKDTRQSIWMDSLPEWVVRRIDGLSFTVGDNLEKSTSPASERTPSVELWKKLVESPDQWVDNRTSKTKPNHPDFKHKVTGEALWLGRTTPTWVHTKIAQLQIAKAA